MQRFYGLKIGKIGYKYPWKKEMNVLCCAVDPWSSNYMGPLICKYFSIVNTPVLTRRSVVG